MKNRLIYLVTAAALVGGVSTYANTTKHVHHNKSHGLAKDVQILKAEVKQLREDNKKAQNILKYNMVEPYAHGSAVVTSPSIGVRDAYKPSDLMINLPSMNTDLRLLEERQKLDKHVAEHNISLPDRPILSISGDVEGTFTYKQGYTGPKTVNANLNSAELDVIGEINPWVTAAMMFSYNDDSVSASAVQLDTGYITIGRLSESPFYFTVGQIVVPFGDYTNYRISSPSTKILGKIKQRAALVGYSKAGFYGSVYGFQGNTHVDGSVDVLKRGGLNLGYGSKIKNVDVDFGVGYTGNIAESMNMQGGSSVIGQILSGIKPQEMVHRVPGADVHASAKLGKYKVVGEFVTATRSFDADDQYFNGHGAKPRALDLEANYDFAMWSKPSSVAIGYGQTWNAVTWNVPQYDCFVSVRTSWWKDTIEAIEYRRDVNYAAGTAFSGHDNMDMEQDGHRHISNVGSRHANSVLARIGVYF